MFSKVNFFFLKVKFLFHILFFLSCETAYFLKTENSFSTNYNTFFTKRPKKPADTVNVSCEKLKLSRKKTWGRGALQPRVVKMSVTTIYTPHKKKNLLQKRTFHIKSFSCKNNFKITLFLNWTLNIFFSWTLDFTHEKNKQIWFQKWQNYFPSEFFWLVSHLSKRNLHLLKKINKKSLFLTSNDFFPTQFHTWPKITLFHWFKCFYSPVLRS